MAAREARAADPDFQARVAARAAAQEAQRVDPGFQARVAQRRAEWTARAADPEYQARAAQQTAERVARSHGRSLLPGVAVTLRGLSGSRGQELNGRGGIVRTALDASTGRVSVDIDGEPHPLAIAPVNLRKESSTDCRVS